MDIILLQFEECLCWTFSLRYSVQLALVHCLAKNVVTKYAVTLFHDYVLPLSHHFRFNMVSRSNPICSSILQTSYDTTFQRCTPCNTSWNAMQRTKTSFCDLEGKLQISSPCRWFIASSYRGIPSSRWLWMASYRDLDPHIKSQAFPVRKHLLDCVQGPCLLQVNKYLRPQILQKGEYIGPSSMIFDVLCVFTIFLTNLPYL